MSDSGSKEQSAAAQQQQAQLQADLAEEKRKKDEEDKRIQAGKVRRLKGSSTAPGGLFGSGETLG